MGIDSHTTSLCNPNSLKMFQVLISSSSSSSHPQETISFTIMAIVFFLFAKLFTTKGSSRTKPLPPGPKPLPYFGNFIQMLQSNQPTFRWIHKLMEDFQTQIMCLRFGPSIHVIVVSSPKLAREFLKRNDAVFASRPNCLSGYLTSGGYLSTVLAPNGEQWKKMRKMLNQNILSPARHKWLESKRTEEADHLFRYIFNQIQKNRVQNGGGLVNVRVAAQHYCGNVIRKMIFNKRLFGKGMEDGGPGEEEVEHVAAVFTILEYLYAFCVSDYFPWLRGKLDLDGHEKIMRTAIKSMRKYQDPLIDERIRMWKDGNRRKEEDLLDVLINVDSPKLTPDEIKAQIGEMILAAVDNPSNGIEWALAEMILEPQILQKAVEEVDRVVGKERLVQESDLPHLNYIKACAKEAFRLHPMAPFNVPHVSMEDTTVAGYFIPKGSHLLLSRTGLGRNPEVWPDPLRFYPDRHLSDERKEVVLTDHELRMLSFSTGRRGCAGIQLGTTMTAMLLARMVQGFSWEAPPNGPGIELVESRGNLSMAKPLVAMAKPRLAEHLYL